MRKEFLADRIISFPMWVEPATPCRTRTFSTVIPRGFRGRNRHGAIRLETTFINRPVRKSQRKGLPGHYIAWADINAVSCPETGYADCKERTCGIHYMDAPLRLEAK